MSTWAQQVAERMPDRIPDGHCRICRRRLLACTCDASRVPLDAYDEHWRQRYASEGLATVDRMGVKPDEIEERAAPQRAMLVGLGSYLTKVGRHERVFEFGCGTGRLLSAWKDAGWICRGTDRADDAIRYSTEAGLHAQKWNGERTNLPDDWADVVYTYTVLQHVPDAQIPAIRAELRRLVRPGGVVMLTENTTEDRKPGKPWVFFRPTRFYARLFSDWRMDAKMHDYGKERHTTMAFRCPS